MGRVRLKDGTYKPVFIFSLLTFFVISVMIVKQIALVVGMSIFLYAFYTVLTKRNFSGNAHKFSAFFVGSEVFWRMSKSGLPWEFAKIAVIALLLTAIIVESEKRHKPYIYLLYLFLFIPAIFVPEFTDFFEYRKRVAFNLIGEVLLVLSVFYFYNRKFESKDLADIGKWMIYGLFLMSIMILLKSPSYDAIEYGRQSNFAASGGFGPNQVSVMFGLGILLLGYFIIKDIKLFNYKYISYVLLVLFSFQGLFTLSRGGLMAAFIALIFGLIVIFLFKPKIFFDFFKKNILKIFIISFLGVFAFIQADIITKGAISKRYFNKDAYGQQIRENYSSYRDQIVKEDLHLFWDNIMTGVGPGQSMILRAEKMHGEIHAAHIEFSRMLSEHGILGLIALFLVFIIPIIRFFKIKDFDTKFTLTVFIAFALLTMSHNAMRVAIPGFFYGLGFILLYSREIKYNLIGGADDIIYR